MFRITNIRKISQISENRTHHRAETCWGSRNSKNYISDVTFNFVLENDEFSIFLILLTFDIVNKALSYPACSSLSHSWNSCDRSLPFPLPETFAHGTYNFQESRCLSPTFALIVPWWRWWWWWWWWWRRRCLLLLLCHLHLLRPSSSSSSSSSWLAHSHGYLRFYLARTVVRRRRMKESGALWSPVGSQLHESHRAAALAASRVPRKYYTRRARNSRLNEDPGAYRLKLRNMMGNSRPRFLVCISLHAFLVAFVISRTYKFNTYASELIILV